MGNVIEYKTESGGGVKLTPQIVRDFLTNGDVSVTDKEVELFIKINQYQKLNPFLRDTYLIKYSKDKPANIVTGKDVFTKRASKNSLCDGWKAGIVVLDKKGDLIYREGTLRLASEKLVGGWCEVKRKDWQLHHRSEVSLEEYNTYKSMWKSKPAVMIQKVAIVTALRNTFPEDFSGLYSAEEMPVDVEKLDTRPVDMDRVIQSPTQKIASSEEPLPKEKYTDVVTRCPDGDISPVYEKISPSQLKFLHATREEQGITPDEARIFLAKCGYKSSKDICKADFDYIIDWMQGKNLINEEIEEVFREEPLK